jgi:hypothetical protein
MSSYSYAETFTRVHAQRLAGRVTTDLRQSYLLYGSPSESMLEKYREELKELLVGGYVDQYQFGYTRAGNAVWSLRYQVGPDGALSGTGIGGGVPARVGITGATFFNFLTPSSSWYQLSTNAREAVERRLPFARGVGAPPGEAGGFWASDRTYAAGGVVLERSVFRSVAA